MTDQTQNRVIESGEGRGGGGGGMVCVVQDGRWAKRGSRRDKGSDL